MSEYKMSKCNDCRHFSQVDGCDDALSGNDPACVGFAPRPDLTAAEVVAIVENLIDKLEEKDFVSPTQYAEHEVLTKLFDKIQQARAEKL